MTEDYVAAIASKDCFVFEKGGEVMGFLALEYDPDEEGLMVDNVAVDPVRQGAGVSGRWSSMRRLKPAAADTTRSCSTPTRR
jgi:N-acetylglutamate synthase-like GNAT family acetyltransferase